MINIHLQTKLNAFIESLIDMENRENLPDNFYSDAKEKYQFGECETLVSYLYLLDDERGEKFEINSKKDIFAEDFPSHHYVYKSSEGKFYDINGRFDSLNELAEASDLFENYQIEDNLLEYINKGSGNMFITEKDWKDIEYIINNANFPDISIVKSLFYELDNIDERISKIKEKNIEKEF